MQIARRLLLSRSIPPVAFANAFLVLNGYAAFAGNWASPEKANVLSTLGPVTWILALFSFAFGVGSLLQQLKGRAEEKAASGEVEGLAILGEPFLTRRGRRGFLAIFIAYFSLFSWASTILVVRPGEDFTAAYGVQVPSVQTAICCGPVGTVPTYTVYVMQGLGLLLIPANVLLALSVSWLAALSISVSLAAFSTWRATSRGAGGAGLAGVVGFVASCPSCAGQVLLGAILGTGSTAFALALAPWQLYLALASVGVLVATLWAQTRWIANSRRPCPLVWRSVDSPRSH